MEAQFILNVGGLDRLGFTEKEFLELLEIDVSKAVPCSDTFGCPKCKRTVEDTFFTFNSYQEFDLANTTKDNNVHYKHRSLNYHLCICGSLYMKETETTHIVAPQKIFGHTP